MIAAHDHIAFSWSFIGMISSEPPNSPRRQAGQTWEVKSGPRLTWVISGPVGTGTAPVPRWAPSLPPQEKVPSPVHPCKEHAWPVASCFFPTMEQMGRSMPQRWQPHPPQCLGSTSAGLGKPVERGVLSGLRCAPWFCMIGVTSGTSQSRSPQSLP